MVWARGLLGQEAFIVELVMLENAKWSLLYVLSLSVIVGLKACLVKIC